MIHVCSLARMPSTVIETGASHIVTLLRLTDRAKRPDHIAPELEFLALLLVKEGYARMSGEVEGAELCATARGKFMVEHLGAWLPSVAEHAREAQGGEPLARLVQVVLKLVEMGA